MLDEYKDAEKGDPIMFVFQPGVTMKINKMFSFAVSGSYYWNSDVKGSSFAYSSHSNTRDAAGNLIYNYSALSFNGKLDAKFGGPVPGAGVFGTFVNSDADNKDTGWLAGLVVRSQRL